MPGKDRFLDIIGVHRSFTIPGDPAPSQIFTVLANVQVTVYKLQSNGLREATAAVIYSNRTGTVKTNPFVTGTNGRIDFFADPAEYEMDIVDLNNPARIASEIWNWSAVPGGYAGIASVQLPGGLAESGDIKMVGWSAVGGADPTGWLWCDGRVLSRTTYADLFAKIGISYNSGGETISQFRIPDLRGSVPSGADSFGTSAGPAGRLTASGALGNRGGTENNTISTANLPAHSHPVIDPAHAHAVILYANGGGAIGEPFWGASGFNSQTAGPQAGYTDQVGTGISIGNTGGGNPINNKQPYQCVAHLIKI